MHVYVRIVQSAYAHVYVRPGGGSMYEYAHMYIHYSTLKEKQNKIKSWKKILSQNILAMLCRNFKFPLPCSSGLPLDEKRLSRLLFIIIHTGNLDLSKGILPFATSSVDDAGAHFLAFLFLTVKKTLLFFPSPCRSASQSSLGNTLHLCLLSSSWGHV